MSRASARRHVEDARRCPHLCGRRDGGGRGARRSAARLHRPSMRAGPWVGAVPASAIYSSSSVLGHFEQGYDAMIATGLLGLVLGPLYVVRRSIVAPMVSHAAFNLAQLLKYLALAARSSVRMLSRREPSSCSSSSSRRFRPSPRGWTRQTRSRIPTLRSLWFDHDVSFENEYRYFTIITSRRRRTSTTPSWSAPRRQPDDDQLRHDGLCDPAAPFHALGDLTAFASMRAAGPRRRGGRLLAAVTPRAVVVR